MFLKMAVLRAIYIGNIGKTAKIRHFVDLNLLNGHFYANFIAYPLGADARDILAQFWGVKNFVLGLGVPKRGQKLPFLAIFRSEGSVFTLWTPQTLVLGLKWDFCPGWGIIGTI